MIRKTKGEKAFDILNILFMLFLIAVTAYPYLNSLALSLNDGMDASKGGITIFPRVFTLENYEGLFKSDTLPRALLISIARVISGTTLTLLVTAFAAYAIKLKQLPGRNIIMTFFIVPMFISGGLIPTYILFKYLHLFNNFLVYIVPGAFSVFNMVVMRTYFSTIPQSLDESALIDGATEPQVFFRIALPLSKPVLATIGLWSAVGHWNDWTTTLYYITKNHLFPVQYLLVNIIKDAEAYQSMLAEYARKGMKVNSLQKLTPESVRAAMLIASTLPIIVVYPFLQKYFVSGVTIGAIKE